MSVGGKVIETMVLADRVWVNTDEASTYQTSSGEWVTIPSTECAIYVERTAESRAISEGDSLWWQGRWAFWTPRNRAFEDRRLSRIGYSGVSRPTVETVGTQPGAK